MASDLRCGIGAPELVALRRGLFAGDRWWSFEEVLHHHTSIEVYLNPLFTFLHLYQYQNYCFHTGYEANIPQMTHGASPSFKKDAGASTLDYARSLDAEDPLRHLREEFHIPTKADLKREKLEPDGQFPS